MNIFLTGASGFVGSEFLKYVKNKKVFVYSLSASKIKSNKIKVCKGRLDDKHNKELTKCKYLLHLASSGVNDKNISYKDLYKTNVKDSSNYFKMLQKTIV